MMAKDNGAMNLAQAIEADDLAGAARLLRRRGVLKEPHQGLFPLTRAVLKTLHAPATTSLAMVDLLIAKGGWVALPAAAQRTWLMDVVNDPQQPQDPRDLGIGGAQRLVAVVDRCLPLGLNVNEVNAAGEHALFDPIRRADPRWCMALIAIGVDPTQPRADGRYAHEVADENAIIQASPSWQAWLDLVRAQVRARQRFDELNAVAPSGSGRRLRS